MKKEDIEGEYKAIKQILDHFDEFGHPIDPEYELPKLASRVYGALCELMSPEGEL